MHLLALDIGTKRTGVALGDTVSGFLVALETIKHRDDKEQVAAILNIVREKQVGELIVGLPLLPQGAEGSQAFFVRSIVDEIQKAVTLPVKFIDERYTTQRKWSEPDARAACDILEIELNRRKKVPNTN